MATENTAQTAQTAAPAVKPPSKMSLARDLLAEIIRDGCAEGSSIRKDFIARAQTEINLTASGAVTYYNNLNNEAKGKGLYAYSKSKAKAETEGAADDAEGDQAPTAEDEQPETTGEASDVETDTAEEEAEQAS